MDIPIQMPPQAILRPGNAIDVALQNSSIIVPSRQQEEFSQISEARNWTTPENLLRLGLMRMFECFVRQLKPPLPLPLFTRPHSPTDLPQKGHSNLQRRIFENRTVQDSSTFSNTMNANMSHRRTSRPARRHQHSNDLPKARHEQQKRKLMTLLHPVVQESDSDCSHLFLCWGKKDQCKILAIKIPNSADDVAIWQLIRQTWYRHRGRWRRYIHVLDVQQVNVVKVSIAGPQHSGNQKSKDGGHFMGTCSSVDFDNEKRRLEETIARYVPQEYPCAYDTLTGSTDCTIDCVADHFAFTECPERMRYHAQRQLLQHPMLPFLKLAFYDPKLAEGNNLFEDKHLIKSHQDILSKLNKWHCPRMGELDFEGLWLDDALESRHAVLLSIAALLILTVLVSKPLFGDWSTAWTFECFIVALVTLYWMCTSETARL